MVIAPSASDLESSKSWLRSISETVPRPSQRGHMPPVLMKVRFTVLPAPWSIVIAPLPRTEGTLKENAFDEPMCGCPSRLNRTRSIALAAVAVPTVERALAPIRSWSTMIAVVRPSSTSTSGRASVGMKPCTKVLYVSLISRCDSAAIVPNTRELLPEPETPVNTVSRRFGISTLTSLRLFSRPGQPRAPPSPWAGGLGILHEAGDVAVGVLDRGHQLAAGDVARLLWDGRARGDELLERLVDVVDKPVRKWRGHPLSVAVGVESDVLATDVPADVVRRLVGRPGPQQRGVHLLRTLQVLDRVDNRLH